MRLLTRTYEHALHGMRAKKKASRIACDPQKTLTGGEGLEPVDGAEGEE